MVNNGLCLDPTLAAVEGSSSFDVLQTFSIRFTPCFGEGCNSDPVAWAKQEELSSVYIFYSYSFVDLEDINEPFKQTIAFKEYKKVAYDSINQEVALIIHQVDLIDTIASPVPIHDEQSFYLTIDEFESVDAIGEVDQDIAFSLKVRFNLGSTLALESRTRYTAWDLLGDVGGFHDGIFIVVSLFMSSYSAVAF